MLYPYCAVLPGLNEAEYRAMVWSPDSGVHRLPGCWYHRCAPWCILNGCLCPGSGPNAVKCRLKGLEGSQTSADMHLGPGKQEQAHPLSKCPAGQQSMCGNTRRSDKKCLSEHALICVGKASNAPTPVACLTSLFSLSVDRCDRAPLTQRCLIWTHLNQRAVIAGVN
jgi:hypothetical protein